MAARSRKLQQRRQHLPEATAAAEAVARALNELHPNAPWIHQVCDGVIRLVEQSMRQLAHAGPGRNAQPFIPGQPNFYAAPARTAAEVQAERAADERQVSRLRPNHVGQGGEIVAGIQDPAADTHRYRRALQQRQERQGGGHAERDGDGDGEVRWLL